jgi:hypothetical protein
MTLYIICMKYGIISLRLKLIGTNIDKETHRGNYIHHEHNGIIRIVSSILRVIGGTEAEDMQIRAR